MGTLTHDPGRRGRRRGYTLIELAAVMTLLAILSIAATPAISSMLGTRERALAAETARLLAVARARAAATGEPTGVRFEDDGSWMSLVRIAGTGESPSAVPGEAARSWAAFGSARIGDVENGDGTALRTIWFGAHGRPEVRRDDGALVGDYTQDAVVDVGGSQEVTVTRATGMVTR